MKKTGVMLIVFLLIVIPVSLVLGSTASDKNDEGFLNNLKNFFFNWLVGAKGPYGECQSDDECPNNQFCNLDTLMCEPLAGIEEYCVDDLDCLKDKACHKCIEMLCIPQDGYFKSEGDELLKITEEEALKNPEGVELCQHGVAVPLPEKIQEISSEGFKEVVSDDCVLECSECMCFDENSNVQISGAIVGNINIGCGNCYYEDEGGNCVYAGDNQPDPQGLLGGVCCNGRYYSDINDCEEISMFAPIVESITNMFNPVEVVGEYCMRRCMYGGKGCSEEDLKKGVFTRDCCIDSSNCGGDEFFCNDNVIWRRENTCDTSKQECVAGESEISKECGVCQSCGVSYCDSLISGDDGWVKTEPVCGRIVEGTPCALDESCTESSCPKSGCLTKSTNGFKGVCKEIIEKPPATFTSIFAPEAWRGGNKMECVQEVIPEFSCKAPGEKSSPCDIFEKGASEDESAPSCTGSDTVLEGLADKLRGEKYSDVAQRMSELQEDLKNDFLEKTADDRNRGLSDEEILKYQVLNNEDNIARMIALKQLSLQSRATGSSITPYPYPNLFNDDYIDEYFANVPGARESDLYADYLTSSALKSLQNPDFESAEKKILENIEKLNSVYKDPFIGENPKATKLYEALASLEASKFKDYTQNPSKSEYSPVNAQDTLKYINKARSTASLDEQEAYCEKLAEKEKEYLNAMAGALKQGKEWGEEFIGRNFPESWEEYCETRGIDPNSVSLAARIHYNSLLSKERRFFQSNVYGCVSEGTLDNIMDSREATMSDYCRGFESLIEILDKYGCDGIKKYCLEASDDEKIAMISAIGASDIERTKERLDKSCSFSDVQILAHHGDTSELPAYEDDSDNMGSVRLGLGRSSTPPFQFKFAGAPKVQTMMGTQLHEYANFDNYPYTPLTPFEARVYQDELDNLNGMLLINAGTATAGGIFVGGAVAGGQSVLKIIGIMEGFGLASKGVNSYLKSQYPEAEDVASFGTELFDAGLMFGLVGAAKFSGAKHISMKDSMTGKYQLVTYFESKGALDRFITSEITSKFDFETVQRYDMSPNGIGTYKVDGKTIRLGIGKPAEGVEITSSELDRLGKYLQNCRGIKPPEVKPTATEELGLTAGESNELKLWCGEYEKCKGVECENKVCGGQSYTDSCEVYPEFDHAKSDRLLDIIVRYRDQGETSGITKQQAEDATNYFLNANRRLANYLWRTFDPRKILTRSEGENAALSGMAKVLKDYDPALGKFSTFAMNPAKWEIGKLKSEKVFGVQNLNTAYYKYFEVMDDFYARNGRQPVSYEELREDFIKNFYEKNGDFPTEAELEEALPPAGVKMMDGIFCRYKQIKSPRVSLDKPISDEGEIIPREDTRIIGPEQEAICRERAENVDTLLESDALTNKQKEVIKLKYQGYTLDEISIITGMKEGGYSPEAVEFAIGKYKEYLEEFVATAYTEIFKKVQADVKSKYGKEPNFVTRERISQIAIDAEEVIRSRLIWGKVTESVELENEIFAEGESVLTERQRDIMKRYHGIDGERQSFEKIAEELGSKEDLIRKSYRGGLNRLNKEYDFRLDSAEGFKNKFLEPDWSSMRDDPSLCKPLPETEVSPEPNICEPAPPLSETPKSPSPLDSGYGAFMEKINEAKKMVIESQTKSDDEIGRKTTWTYSEKGGYIDSEVVIFERVDALGNVYEKRAVILGNSDSPIKLIDGEAYTYDSAKRQIIVKRDELERIYLDKYFEKPERAHWRKIIPTNQKPVFFNPQTKEVFSPNNAGTDFIKADFKFYDPKKGIVFFEIDGQMYVYKPGTRGGVSAYTGRMSENPGRAFYNPDTNEIFVNTAFQNREPELRKAIPFFETEFSGRKTLFFNDPKTGKPSVYVEGERGYRTLESFASKNDIHQFYNSNTNQLLLHLQHPGGRIQIVNVKFYDPFKNIGVIERPDLRGKLWVFWPRENLCELPRGMPEGGKGTLHYNEKFGTEFTDSQGNRWVYDSKAKKFIQQ